MLKQESEISVNRNFVRKIVHYACIRVNFTFESKADIIEDGMMK